MSLLLLFLQENPGAPVNVPNAMGAHTWFIITAVGGFLLWSISYSLQLQKEALTRKHSREDVARRKEELLDRIAQLEAHKESGKIGERKYKDELKDLRFQLSKILDRLTSRASHRPR